MTTRSYASAAAFKQALEQRVVVAGAVTTVRAARVAVVALLVGALCGVACALRDRPSPTSGAAPTPSGSPTPAASETRAPTAGTPTPTADTPAPSASPTSRPEGCGDGTCDVIAMEGELCPEDCDTERPVCAGEAGALCWVRIPAGRYLMGSPESEVGRDDDETQHEVVITRPFWMTSTEVTADQWEALGGERSGGCRDGCPIPGVFWWEALGWLNVLSRSEGLEECYILAECEPPTDHPYYCASVQTIGGPGAVGCAGYRLPTEAEWEYAARATSTGPSYGPLDEIAWYDMSTGGVSHPVGLLAPNRWHLFDIMGNLGEWVWDHYAPYDLRVVADPVGPDDARGMIQRGCPFHYWEARCRVAYRIATPGGDSATEGFRPVRTIVGGR